MLPAVNVTVLGRQYTLYTHVHHSYGLNDAFDRSVAHLLTAQQPEHVDSATDSLLHDSVQQEPLDQKDTVNIAADDTEGGKFRALQHDGDLVHHKLVDQNDTANTAAEGGSRSMRQQSTLLAEGRSRRLQESLTVPLEQNDTANAAAEGRSRSMRQQSALLAEGRGRRLQESLTVPLDQNDTANAAAEGTEERSPSTLPLTTLLAEDRSRSMQESITVEHPCLHEGYSQEYAWVAHGAHVAPLPQVQLLGRYLAFWGISVCACA